MSPRHTIRRPCSGGEGAGQTQTDGEDEGSLSSVPVDTTAEAADSAKPASAIPPCRHFCGFLKSSCQLQLAPLSFQS